MHDNSVHESEQAAPAEAAVSPSWKPVWDQCTPALDVESEIEVRFAVLAARYGEMLRRFLLGLTRKPEVAEDLVQQLWLKLLESARSGRFLPVDDSPLRSYLFAAARNLFLDECVRKHGASRTAACDPHTLETLVRADTLDAESPEDHCDRVSLTVRVGAALDQLPVAQQHVIRMWMSGASIDAMTQSTGAPRDTVLSRKKYALRRLRSILADAQP
jgi:RNA polymerase sigma-70 factor (ECF subfamily)